MLCSDLIEVWWKDKSGRPARTNANLEDISNSGACLQFEEPVPEGAVVHICLPVQEIEARVQYCVFRETGYFAGVLFAPGFEWDERTFQPKHLLDPRTLLNPRRF